MRGQHQNQATYTQIIMFMCLNPLIIFSRQHRRQDGCSPQQGHSSVFLYYNPAFSSCSDGDHPALHCLPNNVFLASPSVCRLCAAVFGVWLFLSAFPPRGCFPSLPLYLSYFTPTHSSHKSAEQACSQIDTHHTGVKGQKGQRQQRIQLWLKRRRACELVIQEGHPFNKSCYDPR